MSLPGKIKKQTTQKNKNYPLPASQTDFLETGRSSSNQKPFNQLALSLMGIKRSRINKSCFDNRSSFDIRKSYDNSFQKNSREEVEVYKYSVLPFRADDINGIKN